MIASPLSRRAVVGGIVGAAALSGCSLSESSSNTDGDAADRTRLTRARDMSQQLLSDIEATTAREPHLAEALSSAHALHAEHAAQFAKAARVAAISATPTTGTPLTLRTLATRERALADQFRGLALQADRGDVAALLASAAAGISQTLVGSR